MRTFEYRIEAIGLEDGLADSCKLLNEVGNEGWEAVSCMLSKDSIRGWVLLKRLVVR